MVFLGNIVTQNGVSVNNRSTPIPFTITSRYRYLLLVFPSGSLVTYRVTVDNLISTLTATANDFAYPEQTAAQIACPPQSSQETICAILSSGGTGTVRVYGLFGQAQS